jgi:hypothetical protein
MLLMMMIFHFTPSYFIITPTGSTSPPHAEEQLRDEGFLGSLLLLE